MNINLHIERLVFDGVDMRPGQHHLLQASVQTELARLLAEGRLAAQLSGGGALPHIASPAIQLAGGQGTSDLGKQIAQSIYAGIGV